MKKGITLFLLSLLFITPGCKQSKETIVNEYNIVPLPNQMIPQQGRFEISKKVRVITTACTPDVQIIADSLINRLKLTSGITIKQTFENVTDEPVIRFVPQDGMPEEGYKLSVTPSKYHPYSFYPPRDFSMQCKHFISYCHPLYMVIKR